jgi:hypothetical protein
MAAFFGGELWTRNYERLRRELKFLDTCGSGAFGSASKRRRPLGGVYPEEVDPLKSRNAVLNGAAIGLDMAGSLAIITGGTCALVRRFRHKGNITVAGPNTGAILGTARRFYQART